MQQQLDDLAISNQSRNVQRGVASLQPRQQYISNGATNVPVDFDQELSANDVIN